MKHSSKILLYILVLIAISCNPKSNKRSTAENSIPNQVPGQRIERSTAENNISNQVTEQEVDENTPPFKDTCKCNFKRLGFYKISNDNYNVYLSGKNWNPQFKSCSFTWGEIIFNEIPSDTNIAVLKIHLLDLDRFIVPTDLTDYGNDSIKKYVIAIYYRYKNGHKCIFDPFVTGKYPKPQGWSE